MKYLEGEAGQIERSYAEEEDEPVMAPGDHGYAEFRSALINAAESPQDLDAIYARYPAPTEDSEPNEAHSDVNAERNRLLAEAQTPEDADRIYAEHPYRTGSTQEGQRVQDYRDAVEAANTPEELDKVYAEYGVTVVES